MYVVAWVTDTLMVETRLLISSRKAGDYKSVRYQERMSAAPYVRL